jgi:hypothetical protein
VPGAQSFVGTANSAGNPQADASKATQAHLRVTNLQGVAEQYRVTLSKKNKVTNTWNFTLADGQTWQVTIPYTVAYKMVADLYMPPNSKTPYVTPLNNGQ